MAKPEWIEWEQGGKRYAVNVANIFTIAPEDHPDGDRIEIVSTGGKKFTLSAESSAEFLKQFDGVSGDWDGKVESG